MSGSDLQVKRAVVLGDVEHVKYHPLDGVDKDLEDMLSSRFELTLTEDYNVLKESRLRAFDVLVAYTDSWDEPVSEEQAEGILRYVEDGGGLVVLHTGVSLSLHDKLLSLIGARFVGHPPYQPLSFERLEREAGGCHPIVHDIEPFESEDEPYRYAFVEGVDIEVILQYWLDGEAYTAAWVRQVGKGRLVSLMPGHNSYSLQHPQVRKLIASGCLWAAGEL